ncbi:MAG: hypothetical protein J6Y52_02910 [Bacteroidales bacterium]|nr:hypothetical protein [Bacteroidales bacterium]
MAKIDKLLTKQGYDWKFSTVGGVTRVNIETGDDIAHLDELDQKLWTVLSCPVKGLEFDPKTLALMDTDGDGKIRVHEVVAASQWLKKVLVDMDYLLDGNDRIEFLSISDCTDEGKQVLEAAKMILGKLGLQKEEISLQDVIDYMAVYEEKCKADYTAAETEPYEPPYGEESDAAETAVNAVRHKVADWFMRCRLVQFDEEASPVLDVQVEKIAAISGNDLGNSMDEIAEYPLARPSKEALLPLAKGINPAWQGAMAAVANVPDFAGKETITEEEWNAVVAKVDAYTAWKAAGETAMNEAIAAQVAEHAAAIAPVERLLRYCRDYFTLLQNYVVFKDFYTRDENHLAVFQAGKLYIDQRCCDLCVKVSDMGKSTASAGKSGMYLIYCHCTSKGGAQMDIVAALTDGEIGGLHEGKNAIFYDRAGQDWDATITKIVDNPISVRQAFWSPYRKFGNWVTDKITKSASEKESKQFDEMTNKADTATTNLTVKTEGAAAEAKANEKKAQMFDIAKFAGIFAAIGLAIGAIGGALAALGGFVTAKWYNVILLVAAIIILISGPSMLLAWLKLRKRNLGPVLNANGWAINSNVKVNTAFGKTLTSMAKYPKMVVNDPFAEKKMAWWKKCLIWLAVALVAAFAVLYFTHNLPWQKKAAEEPVVEVVEAVEEPAPEAEAVEAAAEAPAETPAE